MDEWSDEEGEILPDSVDEYYFVDQTDKPIELRVLPLMWSNEVSVSNSRVPVYLRGEDSFYKLAKAWKYDLTDDKGPKIEVVPHGLQWITLQKPRQSYEALIRTTLVTLQCLHFFKRNPEASSDDVWNSLQKVDGVQPSEEDLSDHVSFVCQAMKRDEDLTKSKCLRTFLEKTSQTTPTEECLRIFLEKTSLETPTEEELPMHYHREDAEAPDEQNFIVDNEINEESSSDDDSETNLMFDTVCSLCDNGGYVLCCEGSCLRSFHPTIADGSDTMCESLLFTDSNEVDALGTYLCNNCHYKQHQCYACGQLGSSDENSSQEVFPCSASNCGHFYHPVCVAKLLHASDQIKSEELQAKIAARESFCCPLHICKVCHLSENKNAYPFHFAVCRRCPTAYHRTCLPREITTELNCDEDNLQRAWEKLLPYNRILIYCMDHKIEPCLLTPTRDHLIFPDDISGPRRTLSHGLTRFKENVSSKATDHKPHEDIFSRLGVAESSRPKKSFSGNDYLTKRKMDNAGKRLPKQEVPSASGNPDSEDEDIESRVLSICKKVDSEFSFDDFIKSRGETHIKCYRSGNDLSKITLGLVQTHVNAARAAAKMFKEGRDEDARAIFDPNILHELIKHKRQLEIYLSPFLHGMRYTSFGRHFTKNEKLQEIVERLHWYVQNGDTLVDFCCGSNDFSLFMKEKLTKTGKECFYKNFDLIIPKNDFNFEKRDWLSVRKEELPDGSQLIMGLNPPFGHKASLANTFIRKALEFKPKILILIVPNETKRVDQMGDYDLIWEDTNLLSGMSFYLPGSVDVNDQTIEQWNNSPPPLSLWSRRDWSRSHKTRAVTQGHITQVHYTTYQENFCHAEISPRSDDDGSGMVQDMEISPARRYD